MMTTPWFRSTLRPWRSSNSFVATPSRSRVCTLNKYGTDTEGVGKMLRLSLSQLIDKFSESCHLDGSYFLCQNAVMKKIASMLEKVNGFSLEDRYNFCFAPINVRDPKAMYYLMKFTSSCGQNLPVTLAMGVPKSYATNDSELLDLETKHQVVSAYIWLSNQLNKETFPFLKKDEMMVTDIAGLLGESLIKACWKPESRKPWKSKEHKNEDGDATRLGKPKPQKKDSYDRPMSLVKLQENSRLQLYF